MAVRRLLVIECQCGALSPYITPHAADCPDEDDWYWHSDDPEPPERIAAREERRRREREVVYVPAEVTDEMVERALIAGASWFTAHPDGASELDEWRDHYRRVLESALSEASAEPSDTPSRGPSDG